VLVIRVDKVICIHKNENPTHAPQLINRRMRMTEDILKEVKKILFSYNKWRRGEEDIKQPEPRVLGVAIDDAITLLEIQQARIEELENLLEQPIETAIKDDSKKVLIERKGDDVWYYIGYWGQGQISGEAWVSEDGAVLSPTHWQPLIGE